jgi:hypothetical protein
MHALNVRYENLARVHVQLHIAAVCFAAQALYIDSTKHVALRLALSLSSSSCSASRPPFVGRVAKQTVCVCVFNKRVSTLRVITYNVALHKNRKTRHCNQCMEHHVCCTMHEDTVVLAV